MHNRCLPTENSYEVSSLLLGTNTRVPEEEELMVINIDSSEQLRA